MNNMQDIFDQTSPMKFFSHSDSMRERQRQSHLGLRRTPQTHAKILSKQRHMFDRKIMTPTGPSTIWTLREHLIATGLVSSMAMAKKKVAYWLKHRPTEYYVLEHRK